VGCEAERHLLVAVCGLLQGVLAPEDALVALKYGVDGIIVSNHGESVWHMHMFPVAACTAVVTKCAVMLIVQCTAVHDPRLDRRQCTGKCEQLP
jgi:hypothetical protein